MTINYVYEPGGNLTAFSAWPRVTTQGTSNVGLPTPTRMFLTMPNGAGSHAESLAHFRARCIDALEPESLCTAAGFIRPTTNWEASFLSGHWEGPNFIPPAWPVAVFDDVLDLGVARRVNCSPRSGGTTVCWAPSYHFQGLSDPPGMSTSKPQSLSLIIMADDSTFFGSWEWSGPVLETAYGVTPQTSNFGLDVEHYYAVQGSLRTGAELDSQGRKGVPHACLSCHGGHYDAATGKVIGASLLPLVPSRYARSPRDSAGIGAPQESIRRINQIILQSNPAPAIIDQVNAMYNGSVCKEFTMPHSEILFRKFWTEGNGVSLPALLSTALGFQKCPE